MTDQVIGTNDRGYRIGEYHANSKISDELVDRIREMHEDEGKGYKAIAKALSLSKSTIRDICRYRRRCQLYARWKAVRAGKADE